MSFDLGKFLSSPKEFLLTLGSARKDDLRQIADKATIPYPSTIVKAELLGKVLDFLVNKATISESDAAPLRHLTLGRGAPAVPSEDPEIIKLKLQLEVQKALQETEQQKMATEQQRIAGEQQRMAAEYEHKEKLLTLE